MNGIWAKLKKWVRNNCSNFEKNKRQEDVQWNAKAQTVPILSKQCPFLALL